MTEREYQVIADTINEMIGDHWLDKHIEEQAAYWQRQGFPPDIISQVAELIETYGDEMELLPVTESDEP